MKIKQVFEHAVTIATSSSRAFLPYTAVMIRSIVAHSNPARFYDIIVLLSGRDKELEERIKKDNEARNISIRFFLADSFLPDLDYFTYGHFSRETYYKLFLPWIADAYEKVLFFDSDLIVCADAAELYDRQMDKELVCAAPDADTAGLYNGADKYRKAYTDTVLKLEDPYAYFQAGVVVFHVAAWKKIKFTIDKMAVLIACREWELLDQDILNVLCEHRVQHIPMRWNVMADFGGVRMKKNIAKAPKHLREQYFYARKHPAVIHFAGPIKPWDDPKMDYAHLFWEYARQTSFYEIIIYRKMEQMKLEHRLQNKIRRKAEYWLRSAKKNRAYGSDAKEKEKKWKSGIILPAVKKKAIRYRRRKQLT